MSATEEITYAEVANHSSKKDLYVVIHDTVYNASSFVDEHPYVPPTNPQLPQPIPCPVFQTSWHISLSYMLLTLCKEDSLLINCTAVYRGGEEVLLDVGGQDATEAFEDVGHSDEAREILEGLKVGKLKRVVCLIQHHISSLILSGKRSPPSSIEKSTV
jgi:Cytochrome b5-like Heme/Steroid binding domain